MSKVAAFHSVKPNDPKKYHDNDKCTEGDNIQPENKRAGTGGFPRCKRCTELEQQGK